MKTVCDTDTIHNARDSLNDLKVMNDTIDKTGSEVMLGTKSTLCTVCDPDEQYNFITFPNARDPLDFLKVIDYDITHGTFDTPGSEIPFFWLFRPNNASSKNVRSCIDNWKNYAHKDITKEAGASSRLVRYWISKNDQNQWLNCKDAMRMVSNFTKSSMGCLCKVKLPHPLFNNFGNSDKHCKTHKRMQAFIPKSYPHKMFYQSALKTVFPILEKMQKTVNPTLSNERKLSYYRIHPIWLIFLKYKKYLGEPINGFENIECDIDFSKF